ncbi:hypothetical protein O181_079287 [Austropuccinia psidii MF-1]|uniref:Uncharacterized protein n=1 Tax=Austropuccinia psidii MF-1 TaxID=1389203 RepID=A0A9Q3FJE0_9BASI|nr:hypothetical protein [Austropuccinia psidii MF-1]
MGEERQGIKNRIPLERTRKYWEYLTQKDILQRTNEIHQRVKFKQEVQTSERKGSQYHIQSSYYLCHRREMEPEREYSDFLRIKRSGQTTKLPSGFKPLRHQQISDQKSPYFPIPASIQERGRIIEQEQDFF